MYRPGRPTRSIERIARETTTILQQPDIITRFRQVGLVVVGKGPEALRARLADEVPRWREVIEKGGIKAE